MAEKPFQRRSKHPTKKRILRALEKRAPKLVENGKKTLVLQGTKTSAVLKSVLTEIYHLKKGSAVRYTKKNDKIRPFEAGGETSLEFFSQKTDCSLFVSTQSNSLVLQFGSHSKKRPDNLVLGRTFDHQVYDMVEVGVENFKPMDSFSFGKKLAPKVGSKPFILFTGEGFENVDGLKHLKEVLLDLFREEVVENINLAGVDRVFVCTAVSSDRVFLTHCALRLKRSGTVVPRIEVVEVGPSMDLVVRRHRYPDKVVQKQAFKTTLDKPKKKIKNVKGDVIDGKMGKVFMPDQQIGGLTPSIKVKGLKRVWRESKNRSHEGKNDSKRRKVDVK